MQNFLILLGCFKKFITFAADFKKNLPIENPNTILEEMLSSLDSIGEIWQIWLGETAALCEGWQ